MATCKVKSNITSNEITSIVLSDIITKWDSEIIKQLWNFIVDTSNNIEWLKIKLLSTPDTYGRNIVQSELNRQNNLLWMSVLSYATNSPIYKNIFLDMLQKKFGWVLWTSAEVIKFIDTLGTEWNKLSFGVDNLNNNLYKQIFIQVGLDADYVNANWWDITNRVSTMLKNKSLIDYFYTKEYGFDKLIAEIWVKRYKEMTGKVKWLLKKAGVESNEYTDGWAIINKLFNDDLAGIISKWDTVDVAVNKLDSLMNRMFGKWIKDDYLSYLINDLNKSDTIKDVLNSDIMFRYSLYKQLNSWLIDTEWMSKILDALWYEGMGDWYRFLNRNVEDMVDEKTDDIIKDFWNNLNVYDKLPEEQKIWILQKYKDVLEEQKINQAYDLSDNPGIEKQIKWITRTYNNIIQWIVKVDIKDLPNLIRTEMFSTRALQYWLKYTWKSENVIKDLVGFIDAMSEWKWMNYLIDNKLDYLSRYLDITDISPKWILSAYNNKMFEVLNMVGLYDDYLNKIFDNKAFLWQLDSLISDIGTKWYYVEKINAWRDYIIRNELSNVKMKWNSIEEILKKLGNKRTEYVEWLMNIIKESVLPPIPNDINYVLSTLWGKKINWADKYIYVTYSKNYDDIGQELKDITVNSFKANTIDFSFDFSFDAVMKSDDEVQNFVNANKWKKILIVYENPREGKFPKEWVLDVDYVEPREWLSFKITEDRKFQVQWLDELSINSAQKSLWNIDWILVVTNNPEQQDVLHKSIDAYLDMIGIEDKYNYIKNAERILWGKKPTYNFKEFQKRINLFNSITNGTIIKQYINPLDIKNTIDSYIDWLDKEWFRWLIENMLDSLWIDASWNVRIKDREVIKDLLYQSVVWDNTYLAKTKLLDYLWVNVLPDDMIIKQAKNDIITNTIDKLNVEWTIQFGFDVWDTKFTLNWLLDNKKWIDDMLQKLANKDVDVYNSLPVEVKMFIQTNFYKNKEIFENKQILWFWWTIGEFNTQPQQAASVLGVVNKSIDEVVEWKTKAIIDMPTDISPDAVKLMGERPIININISELKPIKKEWVLYKKQVEKVKTAIQNGEYIEPVIVDKDLHIIDWQHRYQAYKELWVTEIPTTTEAKNITNISVWEWIHTIDNKLLSSIKWEEFLSRDDLNIVWRKIQWDYFSMLDDVMEWKGSKFSDVGMQETVKWLNESMKIYTTIIDNYISDVNKTLDKKLSLPQLYQEQKRIQQKAQVLLYNETQRVASDFWALYNANEIKKTLFWVETNLLFAPTKDIAKELETNKNIMLTKYKEITNDILTRLDKWVQDMKSWEQEYVSYFTDMLKNWEHTAIIWWKPYKTDIQVALIRELDLYEWWSKSLTNIKKKIWDIWVGAFDGNTQKDLFAQFFMANNIKKFNNDFMGTFDEILKNELWLGRFIDDSEKINVGYLLPNTSYLKPEYQMIDYTLPKILSSVDSSNELLRVITTREELFNKVDAMAVDSLIKKSYFSRISWYLNTVSQIWLDIEKSNKIFIKLAQDAINDVINHASQWIPTISMKEFGVYTKWLADNMWEFIKAKGVWLFDSLQYDKLESFAKSSLDDLNRKSKMLSQIIDNMDNNTINNLSKNTITTDVWDINVWQYIKQIKQSPVEFTNNNLWQQISDNIRLIDDTKNFDSNTSALWTRLNTKIASAGVDTQKIISNTEETLYDYCDLIILW